MTEQQATDRVRKLHPKLDIKKTAFSAEGASNDVLIVNDKWVYRFAKNEAAEADLAREAAIIEVLRNELYTTVPESELIEPGVMRQAKIAGQPLDRHTLLRQPAEVQDRLVEEMAHFLYEIHRAPQEKLRSAGVGCCQTAEGIIDAIALYHDCERELFKHLKSYAVDVIREHFVPVLEGKLLLAAQPVLIHGDLNPSHIIWDPEKGRFVGIIDFGMAGFGDSALDYAAMLQSYGETALRRMNKHHKSIGEKIDRARFWALAIELKLTLSGLRSGEARWFCAHLGTARDMLPIGTEW